MIQFKPTYDVEQLAPEIRDRIRGKVVERLAGVAIDKMNETQGSAEDSGIK